MPCCEKGDDLPSCSVCSRGSSKTSTKIKTYLKITTVRNYKVDPTIYTTSKYQLSDSSNVRERVYVGN